MMHLCKTCWNMPTRAESAIWVALGAATVLVTLALL